MLKKLEIIKSILPELLIEKANLFQVQTMYIDYHKPIVSRIWFQHLDLRVYLHKIEPCGDSLEALYHPHKWNSAMEILRGSYEMGIGHSDTNETPKTDCTIILNKGSKYEMIEPNGWHYVNPIKEPAYTLMVTGKLNGREMPIEPNKEFRKLTQLEILDILLTIEFPKYISLVDLVNKIYENEKTI